MTSDDYEPVLEGGRIPSDTRSRPPSDSDSDKWSKLLESGKVKVSSRLCGQLVLCVTCHSCGVDRRVCTDG